MLVLSRTAGERILIGDEIVVELVEVRGDRVKIGITAPREIQIDRSEVRDQKRDDEKR